MQHRKCPQHFQDRLTRIGGLNRYGEPNFLIAWGPSWTVRRGGTWERSDGSYFRGYKDVIEEKRPCWVLKQWQAPEVFGSPDIWFLDNIEPQSGLQLLGDYPWKGMYQTLQPFVYTGIENGKLVIECLPLSNEILDMIIPLAIAAQNASATRKRIAVEEIKEREERSANNQVEDARHDAKLAFKGPVSFARQGCRTSLIDKRAYQIQQSWNLAMANARRMMQRGMGMSIA